MGSEMCIRDSYTICATNMLLLDGFGMAVKEIEKEGFKVEEKIYMALDGYNVFTTTKSMGVLLNSFVDTVQRVKPDWILLAGDRSETLVASIVGIAANIYSIKRFHSSNHKYKWHMTALNVSVIGLLAGLMVMDLTSLF